MWRSERISSGECRAVLLCFLSWLPSLRADTTTTADAGGNPVAITTFLLFSLATLGLTWWAAKRTRTRNDFYVAGNSVNSVMNGFAIAGDTMSAASFIGIVGLALLVGFDILYFLVCVVLSWVVILCLIAERLRNLGTYTFADAVSLRLAARPMRILAACGSLAVVVPYLVAQIVAAGSLMELLFGLSYLHGVIVIGGLTTIYVAFGGMLATTWVQIVKAVLLLAGGSILAFGLLLDAGFDINGLMRQGIAAHPQGAAIFQPGLLFGDFISVLSLMLAFIGGTAGMPHVLMRFFTVPGAFEARRSAVVALGLIAYFQIVVAIIGLGAVALLVNRAPYAVEGVELVGGSNMAAIHLSHLVGGDVFMGFISAVVFATILAVVSGLALSAAATVAHDIYAHSIRGGECSPKEELLVSRVTIIMLGLVCIFLALLFRDHNVGILVTLPLVIAASTNFPILLLTMYWRGLTTRGALIGGYSGLVLSLLLLTLGPFVWVDALGFDEPLFPYAYPTLFSMTGSFLLAWFFSITDRSKRAVEEQGGFECQLFRAEIGSLPPA